MVTRIALYLAPVGHFMLPFPCIWFLCHLPWYMVPLRHTSVPYPCRFPDSNCPQYSTLSCGSSRPYTNTPWPSYCPCCTCPVYLLDAARCLDSSADKSRSTSWTVSSLSVSLSDRLSDSRTTEFGGSLFVTAPNMSYTILMIFSTVCVRSRAWPCKITSHSINYFCDRVYFFNNVDFRFASIVSTLRSLANRTRFGSLGELVMALEHMPHS